MNFLGIDEAGRGCVIGPMVVAGVVADQKQWQDLARLGVKDSKLLSPKKRRQFVQKIERGVVDKKLIIISPAQIDKVSLNELDLQAIVQLITKYTPQKAIFDVPTHPQGVKRFVESVKLRIKKQVELVGENKADEKYPLVSAASILAKVKRDEIIEDLKQKYGDFGSGYMSDPKTQNFLEEYYEKHKSFPEIVRTKWASAKRLLFQQQNLSMRSHR